MSGFKPFRVGDHVNLPADRDKMPKLRNMPPSNVVSFSIRELFTAICDKYKAGSDESIQIGFTDDGLEIVEIDGEGEKMSDEVALVQRDIDELSKPYDIVIDWKYPESRMYGSARYKRTVRCVFKTA